MTSLPSPFPASTPPDQTGRNWLTMTMGLVGCLVSSACDTGSLTTSPVTAYEASPSLIANHNHTGQARSLFVRYRPDAPTDRVARLVTSSVRYANDLGGSGRWIAMEVNRDSADSTLASLRNIPWIEHARLGTDNFRITGPTVTETPIPVRTQIVPWGIDNTDVLHVHSVSGNTGDGIKVAVLDTGIECSHPDLSDRAQSGYDFVNMTSSGGCVALLPHGTMVAGIIAAADDNYGVIGMAPEADIYSVRVCGANELCTDAALASGIHWAKSNGMDVINISIGNCGEDLDPAVEYALEVAVGDGIVVVASAGNGTHSGCFPSVPVSSFGAVPEVIIVGAYFSGDTVNSAYQFGSRIDISAPAAVLTDSGASSTGLLGGTSAATPHVSGAAALLIKAGVPASQVRATLTSNIRDLGLPGKDVYFGHGALDALSAAVPGPQVGTITHCTGGVVYTSCLVTPTRTWGVPLFQWNFRATYSNGTTPPDSTGWQADSTFLVTVFNGNYEIQIDMWVREDSTASLRKRVSNKKTYHLQVCDDGIDDLLAICPPTM